MTQIIYLCVLFFAKVLDNTLNTTKTILVQRNKCLLAGLTVIVSDFIYLTLVKNILTTKSTLAIAVVSVAGGIGCCIAVILSTKLSKDKTYVNVIMSDNKEAMESFRDFLAHHHITNVAQDSYTKDWNKTITITAYAETKAQSRIINQYIEDSPLKFKRMIQKA